MKRDDGKKYEVNGKQDRSYVNHALSVSDSLDIGHPNGSHIHSSHGPHHDTRGSSDFILVEEPGDDEIKHKDSNFVSAFRFARQRVRSACTKKTLYKRLPILRWLPKYNGEDALGDFVAGITVGLTVIPQSLAYSSVAGLPPQFGLYGSFLGCFIYIIFGSCKDIPLGPSAIVSLLTYQTVSHLEAPIQHAILLCFLSGLIELFMGLFGLDSVIMEPLREVLKGIAKHQIVHGDLHNAEEGAKTRANDVVRWNRKLGLGLTVYSLCYILDIMESYSSSGFTSAVALIIVTSQIKDILGIKAKGATFLELWKSIADGVYETSPWDAALGVSCIAFLLILRLIATVRIGPKDEELRTTKHKILNKMIWLFGTSRNAILVIVCGILGYSFTTESPFKLIGYLPSGMPNLQPPPFSYTKADNTTASFMDMCSNLGSGLLVLPLISLMEDVAICKAFANGRSVDATQELIALGMSNLGNSFVQAFPGTGSLSRSAVNNASGVRTPLGGLYTGLLVVLALLFLTPYFFYIPKACLAAIIIAAVIFMVEVKVIKPMWRTKKSDLLPGLGTFIACLVLQLEVGLLCGVGLNVLFILYHAARPKISVEKLTSRCGVEFLMLTPDRCLIFPSVDYMRNLVTKYSRSTESVATPVVIDCSHIYGADFTAAMVIESLTKDFAARGQPLFFYNLKPSVYAVFEGVEPTDFVVYYTQEALDELLKERGYLKQLKQNIPLA